MNALFDLFEDFFVEQLIEGYDEFVKVVDILLGVKLFRIREEAMEKKREIKK